MIDYLVLFDTLYAQPTGLLLFYTSQIHELHWVDRLKAPVRRTQRLAYRAVAASRMKLQGRQVNS